MVKNLDKDEEIDDNRGRTNVGFGRGDPMKSSIPDYVAPAGSITPNYSEAKKIVDYLAKKYGFPPHSSGIFE